MSDYSVEDIENILDGCVDVSADTVSFVKSYEVWLYEKFDKAFVNALVLNKKRGEKELIKRIQKEIKATGKFTNVFNTFVVFDSNLRMRLCYVSAKEMNEFFDAEYTVKEYHGYFLVGLNIVNGKIPKTENYMRTVILSDFYELRRKWIEQYLLRV